jgi:hypothetical protein
MGAQEKWFMKKTRSQHSHSLLKLHNLEFITLKVVYNTMRT